ncbi:MAG: O-phosphoserine--tRNA ligase [Candidatus Hodarchaeota archaeon]
MVKFDIDGLLDDDKRNQEKAWLESASLLDRDGNKFVLNKTRGLSHPIYDFIQEARKVLISMGFEETVLPIFVDESDIYKEYGSEAALILDRLFYTAELPRPDIGISNKKIEMIKEIVPDFKKFNVLKDIFKRYKKGTVEADDFLEVMVEELELTISQASEIVDKVFPEFKEQQPIPSKRTLRSHTTALWFPVLGAYQGKKPLPIQLFHVGLKFRREQKLDASHLYESNTLSLVVSNDQITLEDCMNIAKEICMKIGFSDAKFEVKKATGKYYAPGMEFEVFVKHGTSNEWLEIGDGGFYSPISCAKYGIEQPVFNIGFGVERIAMIKTGIADIRELVYPYFYSKGDFTDEDIISHIQINKKPKTQGGKSIINLIHSVVSERGNESAPCEFEIGKVTIDDTPIDISIWEEENGVNLVSHAVMNEIYAKDGEIDCYESSKGKAPEDALVTGIKFIDGIANDFAWKVERFARNSEETELKCQYKMVKNASDINVKIDPSVVRYMTDNQKKIKIKGPVFVNLTARK